MTNCIQTLSGQWIDPLSGNLPCPMVEDIAHALSHLCRFAGHTKTFWSVAHHCLACYHVAPDAARRFALFHDAAEAYIGDWPRPVKHRIAGLREAEERIVCRIYTAFGVRGHVAVKDIDNSACEVERWLLCRGPAVDDPWGLAAEIQWLRHITPTGAKDLFLRAEVESRGC